MVAAAAQDAGGWRARAPAFSSSYTRALCGFATVQERSLRKFVFFSSVLRSGFGENEMVEMVCLCS